MVVSTRQLGTVQVYISRVKTWKLMENSNYLQIFIFLQKLQVVKSGHHEPQSPDLRAGDGAQCQHAQ